MNILRKHVNIVLTMNNNKIEPEFIKKYPIRCIINCCNRIKESKINVNKYANNDLIQEELIRDEGFIKYLNIAYKKEYNMDSFVKLLEQIKEKGEKMSDYSYKEIFCVLNNKKLYEKAYYDFLKYYANEKFNTRNIITNNLNYFYNQCITKFSELTDKQRNLIKLNCLDNYNLIPKYNIKQIYEYLVNNNELRNLIDFLYRNNLYIELHLEDYEKLNKNTETIRQYIEELYNIIKDNEIMYMLLLNWTKNNCSTYDLKIIKDKIVYMEHDIIQKAFLNKASYINFIYGSKLKKFPLDEIGTSREEIIIYAIREDKRSFLKLVEDNISLFLNIPSNSVLYYKDFYEKYINLNELTERHLQKLQKMDYNSNMYLNSLKIQNYTFEEIETLYRLKKQYIECYNELLELKIDGRLLRIRQLSKKNLLDNITNYSDIQKIAKKIKEKPLHYWVEKEFKEIQDIKLEDIISIFIYYEKIQRFLSEIRNKVELSYILRNHEKLYNYNSLKEVKDNIEIVDDYWIKLKECMEFNEDFLDKYSKNIKEFLLKDGAELAYTYLNCCSNIQKESFKLIIKAQIMGQYINLKYHNDDLKLELDYNIKEYQLEEWTKDNMQVHDGKYDIQEYDDFYHTMILGEYPRRTCLSYKGGMYRDCLLACFDSNKKLLYAKINDKIVGRAMVRLTKVLKYSDKQKSLKFIDVENDLQENNEEQEKLTLFLERPYFSGVSEEEEEKIKNLFIELLKKKAKKMDALLVLSKNYNNNVNEEFIYSMYYMYISKSKSSAQYLDSLSGKATVTDEGQYRYNNFYVWNQT